MTTTLDMLDVREQVAAHVVAQMEQASPARRERLIRLLINRLPRSVIDGMWITCAMAAAIPDDEPESEQVG